MNMPIAWLTLRQLLGAKRTLLLIAAALLPITLALVFRFTDPDVEAARFVARTLLGRLVVGTMLPLSALVLGTAAIGSEIEDGTAVYLLSKPLPRRVILLPKLAVSAGLTLVFMVVVTVISGLIERYAMTGSAASMDARRGSRNCGSFRLRPRDSAGSSPAKPGSAVAISTRMQPGSRK